MSETAWSTLVRYHLLAVQRAAAAAPPAVSDRARWCVVDLTREDVITGRGDHVVVDARVGAMFTSAAHDEAVLYGWPLVIVPDRRGIARAAPLVITELETPNSDGPTTAARDEPYLNPGLLSDEFFAPDAIAAAEAVVAAGLPFGDAGAMRERLQAVCAALGLDGSHLDADELAPRQTRMAPGVHNVAAALHGPATLATRALVEELTALLGRTDWDRTAARWLLEEPVRDGGPLGERPDDSLVLPELVSGLPPITSDGLNLNDSQEQALSAAGVQPLTVVTGPPGTGKSQLVAAAVANQWVSGRTVLVASSNNAAVDVAVRRCARIDEALLIRTGNQERRSELSATLEALASRGNTAGPSPAIIRRQLEVAAAARDQVYARLAERGEAEARLGQLVLDVEARRTLLWGGPARPPVYELRDHLHRKGARAARARWGKAFRYRRLLELARPTVPGATGHDVADWAACERAVDELSAWLEELGPADEVRDRDELDQAAHRWSSAGTSALRDTIQHRLHAGAAAVRQLARGRSGAVTARHAQLVRALPHVPGWGCTSLSVRGTFPLDPGLFDLVIIDEASQCSIAHVLPLAYRAKRVLIVGDPHQLTPVVTLTASALTSTARAVGTTEEAMHRRCLSAGRDSAYTAYASRAGAGVHLLAEHYRCHPQIARFFNEQFYAGALRVLSAPDLSDPAATRGLHLIDVPGATRPGRNGGALNQAEADAVVRWVVDHVDEPGTLGVVTPFAAQAALIEAQLVAAVGADRAAAKRLRVGTAHTFQGDERDVMLFSAVLSADAYAGTVRWVENQRNLINVAVSRARRALVVFADTAVLAQSPVPTLHALVELARGRATAEDQLADHPGLHSQAEQRLFAALARRGLTPRLKVDVEGYELDLALETPAGPLDVEVDGIHHTDGRGRQRRQDLVRDQILEGLGWTVYRVPAWRCLAEPDTVAEEIDVGL